MKKQFILLGIVILLISVGLSGCTQESNTANPIELMNYAVTTTWWNKDHTQKNVKPGFYRNLSTDVDNTSLMYLINGTIKNNAGAYLSVVHVGIIFYDSNNNELGGTATEVLDLPNTYTGTFSTDFFYNPVYFDKIENLSFNFTV